ncbi:MAG: PQQ-dependent sugar dehydrogenase [Planctomycetes bacterium]|nr:PQQ-dependent sugar dehydrogenase [Planctomycetota bacterium]
MIAAFRRCALCISFSFVVLLIQESLVAAPAETKSKPSGIARRAEWTTSRITGSPDPPALYRAERIYPGLKFDKPVEMVYSKDLRRPVVIEQGGKIYLVSGDATGGKKHLLLDGAKQIAGLKQCYSIAFHPQFAKNRYCFVCYIRSGELPKGSCISRFTITDGDDPKIDPKSEKIIIEWKSGGHNGCSIRFGPDGFLYICTGDGTAPSPPDGLKTGQDIGDLLSSILRIDVDRQQGQLAYAIPDDNPFRKTPGARAEVWSYGFRNPWRMSFDRKTGHLWVGDVGWELWEMIYRVERGGNYGWSITEGPQVVHPNAKRGPTAILPPVVAHSHAEAASITGGYVYRGQRYKDLVGAYIYGDYATGKIWGLRYDGAKITWHKELADTPNAIVTFYEAADGELAFLDYSAGTIHRLVRNTKAQAGKASFPKKLSETGLFASVEDHRPAPGVTPFSINAEQWADYATAERWVAVPGKHSIALKRANEKSPLAWAKFPKDTVLTKTLSLETERGNPNSRRRIETQILHLNGDSWQGTSGQWRGYTYVWNKEQTDATLAPSEGLDLQITVADRDAPGGKRQQSWRIASRSECALCHNQWSGFRLGFTLEQLSKRHVYGPAENNNIEDDQLRALLHAGVLSGVDEQQLTAGKASPKVLINPHDPSADLNQRAKSYLHANCAHCHRFGGGGTAAIDLRWETKLKDTKMLGLRPTQGSFGIHDARIIAPGDPFRSVLFYRISKLGKGRMPHVGSAEVDRRGVALLGQWIARMKSMDETAAARKLRERQQQVLASLRPAESSLGQPTPLIDELLSSTGGALRLLDAVDRNRLSKAAKKLAVDRGAAHADAQIRDLFERFLPAAQRIKRLGTNIDQTKILATRGDVDRGRELFFKAATMQCRTCHKIGGQGGQVGPDLSKIGKTLDREKLLESIVAPSQKIDPKFQTYLIETTDGRVLTGLLVKKTGEFVEIKTAQAKLLRLSRKDIEQFVPQQKSLMPELLHRDMTAEQLVDLLEFLSSLK